jgi:hypothetical protein
MIQEAPVILVVIGLLKRIADSIVRLELIKNPPSQSPGLPMSDWSLLSAGLYRVHGYLGVPSHSRAPGYRRC